MAKAPNAPAPVVEPYLYEFLYRGRPAGSSESPAWHIIVAAEVPDPLGGPVRHSEKTLNMAQAAEEGWGLPAIIETMNNAAAAEAERLRVELDQAREMIEALSGENKRAVAALNELTRRHTSLVAAVDAARRRAEADAAVQRNSRKDTNPAAAGQR